MIKLTLNVNILTTGEQKVVSTQDEQSIESMFAHKTRPLSKWDYLEIVKESMKRIDAAAEHVATSTP